MNSVWKTLGLVVPLALFCMGCQKDNIVEIDPVSTDNPDDDITNTEFAQTVYVTFSVSGNATVSGADNDFSVTVSDNDVTIIYSGDEYVMYELSGATSDGFFKLYSAKKQGVTLNNVSLTNPNGAAINVQGSLADPSKGKRTFIVLNGENSLADGPSYTNTPDNEDEKAVLFGEGQFIFSGSGSLFVTATGKSGIVSDDYLHFMGDCAITVNTSTSATVSSNDTLKPACIKVSDYVMVSGCTLNLTSSGTGCKGIKSDGNGYFYGGLVTVNVTGSNFGNSGNGGGPGWGDNSSDGVSAKGIKCDGNLVFKGGQVEVNCTAHEGIEAKGTITITDGEVYSYSQSDDAINSGGDFTISGGYVYGYAPSNDGLDANGDFYVKGGVVYAIGSSSPEVAIDANTEERHSLYITGGTLIAIGGLENGTSGNWSQSCYSASSWSQNTWYALTVDGTTYAFMTPSSGGTPLVVSGASTPILQSGVSASNGTSHCGGLLFDSPYISGGTSVSLSSYTGGNGGGGGPGGGGGHGPF
ncbi:MAG: carbohydrate-binding domain-containing protein [Bacteroidales bacterium]|nr:carbohydrate-binding domain-containing protein [Bacteroidales bacterium]